MSKTSRARTCAQGGQKETKILPGRSENEPKSPQDEPGRPQNEAKRRQVRAKCVQSRFFPYLFSLRRVLEPFLAAAWTARDGQEAPQETPKAAKRGPRPPQERPKRVQEGSEVRPKRHSSKTSKKPRFFQLSPMVWTLQGEPESIKKS